MQESESKIHRYKGKRAVQIEFMLSSRGSDWLAFESKTVVWKTNHFSLNSGISPGVASEDTPCNEVQWRPLSLLGPRCISICTILNTLGLLHHSSTLSSNSDQNSQRGAWWPWQVAGSRLLGPCWLKKEGLSLCVWPFLSLPLHVCFSASSLSKPLPQSLHPYSVP